MRADGLWIQHELLRFGWARVYTFADNRRFAAELYTAEHAARLVGRGIWNDVFYALRKADPQALAKDIRNLSVVEGRLLDAANPLQGAGVSFLISEKITAVILPPPFLRTPSEPFHEHHSTHWSWKERSCVCVDISETTMAPSLTSPIRSN